MPVACHPVRYSGSLYLTATELGKQGVAGQSKRGYCKVASFFRAWKFVDSVQTIKMLPYMPDMPGATIHNNEKIEIFKYLQDIYILWRILYI